MAMQAAAEKGGGASPAFPFKQGILAVDIPVIIAYGLFKYWPMVYSFILSFADWNFVGEFSWVGLSNYANMFTTMFQQGHRQHPQVYCLAVSLFRGAASSSPVMLMNVRSKRPGTITRAVLRAQHPGAIHRVHGLAMDFLHLYGLLNNILALLGNR